MRMLPSFQAGISGGGGASGRYSSAASKVKAIRSVCSAIPSKVPEPTLLHRRAAHAVRARYLNPQLYRHARTAAKLLSGPQPSGANNFQASSSAGRQKSIDSGLVANSFPKRPGLVLGHPQRLLILEPLYRVAICTKELVFSSYILQNLVVIRHPTPAAASQFFLSSTLYMVEVQRTRVRKTAPDTSPPVLFQYLEAQLPLLDCALARWVHFCNVAFGIARHQGLVFNHSEDCRTAGENDRPS